MADVKWIKIVTDIFDDDKLKLIDSMPEADAIELMWFKLLVFAGKSNNNGIFFFNDRVAYTDEMLSSVFNRPIQTVRLAMRTFMEFGMIEEINGVYTIPNWEKHQSITDVYEKKKEYDKEYQRKRREKQKLLIEDKKSCDNRTTVVRDCSYSYSKSNSNILNLNNILQDKEYISNSKYSEYLYYINSNERLLECLMQWFRYKDEKKDKYAESSILSIIKKFVSIDYDYSISSIEDVVEYSICNNYKGIVWDKLKKSGNEDTYEGWLNA